jgi:hypothetical protein
LSIWMDTYVAAWLTRASSVQLPPLLTKRPQGGQNNE